MAFLTKETKEKLSTIAKNIQEFADCVDTPVSVGEAGMDMPTEAKVFRDNARDVESGTFKTLVMGKFKNGKSTFVNAMVGESIMTARASACTAVIATVEYGEDENKVSIFYNDPKEPPKVISLKEFEREYSLTDADQEYIINGGHYDRFENVSHVEMKRKSEMFEDGLKLIDSPGLEEAVSRDKVTREFLPKANAIIFTLSATSLFSAAEKDFIKLNFANKNMKNLFFVINRIDNLNAGELEKSVKPTVKKALQEVFTDDKGLFDEYLYNRRVFFTNAYGALCARTGGDYKIILGDEEHVIPIKIEKTGMPEFEAALSAFSNSSERINAAFSSSIYNMANTYQLAENKAETARKVRELDSETRKANAEAALKELETAEESVKKMGKYIDRTAGYIAKAVYADLIYFTEQNNWVAAPSPEVANRYLKSEIKGWTGRIPTVINKHVEDLAVELGIQVFNVAESLARAGEIFVNGRKGGNVSVGDPGSTGTGKAWAQNILALITRDASMITEGSARGGLKWGEFVKRMIAQSFLDSVFVWITGGVFIWFKASTELLMTAFTANRIRQATELLMMPFIANQIRQNTLNTVYANMRDRMVERLSEEKTAEEFKDYIIKEFVKSVEPVRSEVKSAVEEKKKEIIKLSKENEMSEAEKNAENERVMNTLGKMHGCIDNIYESLYGRKPTEAEFLNFSINKENDNDNDN